MTSPEFFFFDDKKEDFLRLRDPADWLIVPGEGSDPILYGSDRGLPEDPFLAIEEYTGNRDHGHLAGWVSYDFARLNPRFRSFGGRPGRFPPVLLAHYPESERVSPGQLEPEAPVSIGSFEPVIDPGEYRRNVEDIRTLIRRGYLYQLNYSQRFRAPVEGTLRSLFARIPVDLLPPRTVYGSWGSWEFLSLSPERFLEVDGRTIRTQPIKGTRPRHEDSGEDRAARDELLASEKDAAEHVMIVDLERNDLNRVCEPGSVHVPELKRLRSFPTVHHLVSTVEGRLRDSVGPADLLRELFPGGSITGCPKPITMRVIDRLENRRRGLYTGSVGYWDRDRGRADWNIAIRTLVRRGERVTWDAGGGIVIDSRSENEYRESLDKVTLIETIRDCVAGSNQQRTGRTAR